MAAFLWVVEQLETSAGGSMTMPVFAVVGHPNKGKSSIVATLAHDDRVAVSPQSGTTRVAETLTVRISEQSYQLVDTPGFQRPHKVLQWLQAHAASAEQRATAVKKFIEDPACQQQFPDEVELLEPIVKGAAILYVVDGSRPYGMEYEAEMEILRWTGQASMALINTIETDSYVEQWQQALSQYFRVVKVFDAMTADFDKQLSILEAFGLLREQWRESIAALVSAARQQRRQQAIDSVSMLAELLSSLCYFQLTREVTDRAGALALKEEMTAKFYAWLEKRERQALDQLQELYGYRNLQSELYSLPLNEDLFDTEKWVVWGLNRKQLLVAASISGAAAGALIDLGLAGSSLLLGALGGGIIAGGSAWLGADRIADFKIDGAPLGGY
ncbi:MAG: DUF3482 domain-containing protein, partial [Pseudohongiellaceae bacterium]